MNQQNLNRQELKIGFIGVGVLGKGLALALADRGYCVSASYSRRSESCQWLSQRIPGFGVAASAQALADGADLVFITTPDAAISQVCAEVDWRLDQGVVHCCGADSRGILDNASRRQALTGAFHPFQTLAGLKDPAEASARLTGVSFAVEAEGWLADLLPQMARDLGGRPVVIPEGDRPLYHASAVLACAHLAALMQGAVTLWVRMGYDSSDAMGAIYPLARATLDNMVKDGVAASMTGPAIRGDAATIQLHLDALSQRATELLPVYTALTATSLPLALQRGVSPDQVAEIEELISNPINNFPSNSPDKSIGRSESCQEPP